MGDAGEIDEHDWFDDYLPHEAHVVFIVFMIVIASLWGSIIGDFMSPAPPRYKGS
jgi:hypothetical protein